MLYTKSYPKKALFFIPVILVIGFTGGLYYCYLTGYLFLVDLAAAIITGIILHLTLILFILDYLICVFTDPGTIPEGFGETLEQIEAFDYNELDYIASKVNSCKKCNLKRPCRTHHCSICNRCVLRMDHHCPFISNCVGFKNSRYFIQLLLYGSLSLTNVGFSCLAVILSGQSNMIQTYIGAAFGLLGFLGLGGFTIFHFYLISKNLTTLEHKKNLGFNVYDTKSSRKNFSQFFGNNLLSIFLPISARKSIDGTTYPVTIRKKNGEEVQYNKIIF